ncbi:hypothetical protein BDV98DRAFT_58868 [Pterulicium gracile]|uniref:Uncharacterized protein n=1 Tax=Pterulicium gracile TaxID=1884261 RepID=A0A5C3Q9N3_9AGAR|nr:hypothetical protein BDV98DRAFT_58868 [Pterula gracilis]
MLHSLVEDGAVIPAIAIHIIQKAAWCQAVAPRVRHCSPPTLLQQVVSSYHPLPPNASPLISHLASVLTLNIQGHRLHSSCIDFKQTQTPQSAGSAGKHLQDVASQSMKPIKLLTLEKEAGLGWRAIWSSCSTLLIALPTCSLYAQIPGEKWLTV